MVTDEWQTTSEARCTVCGQSTLMRVRRSGRVFPFCLDCLKESKEFNR
jgi:hypothetical protein